MAEANGRLRTHLPCLIGSVSTNRQSYLLSVKGPGEEELEATDFGALDRIDSFVEMAGVIGHTLGIAHRHDLVTLSKPQTIDAIAARLPALDGTLCRRSQNAERSLRASFENLANDPVAIQLHGNADR